MDHRAWSHGSGAKEVWSEDGGQRDVCHPRPAFSRVAPMPVLRTRILIRPWEGDKLEGPPEDSLSGCLESCKVPKIVQNLGLDISVDLTPLISGEDRPIKGHQKRSKGFVIKHDSDICCFRLLDHPITDNHDVSEEQYVQGKGCL